jgi:hypothetical protein
MVAKKNPKPEEDDKMNGWIYGWKNIAEFCDCTPETVRKKVVKHHLPVRRDPDNKPVALRSELNAWLQRCKKY